MGLKMTFQLIQAPLTFTFTVQFTGRGNETLILLQNSLLFSSCLMNRPAQGERIQECWCQENGQIGQLAAVPSTIWNYVAEMRR